MHSTDRVKVKIDLHRVASNLRTPGGSSAGTDTARTFLLGAGFTPHDDGTWIGPRAGLLRLNHSEILGVESSGS